MIAAYLTLAAFWIGPNFTAPNGMHCSGPEHCKPVPGRVYFDGDNWRVRGMRGGLSQSQVYWVPRKQPWACMWRGNSNTMTGGELACLFMPRGGG